MISHNTEAGRLRHLIEVNRQRLEHAVRTRDHSLEMRTLALLTQLHSAYFNETKKEFPMRKQELFLVFSEEYQDGVTLTAIEYRALTKRMSRMDLATHVAIPMDEEMREATEQCLVLDLADEARKSNNSGKPKRSA